MIRDEQQPKKAPPRVAAATDGTSALRLFVEPHDGGALETLSVPRRPTCLGVARGERPPRLLRFARSRAVRAASFEPVTHVGRQGLLIVAPPAARVRINGVVAPTVGLLRIGDQLEVDGAPTLHLSEERNTEASAPTPELVGRPCPVCQTPFTVNTLLYRCRCGETLHLEGEATPAERRLECARFGCPACSTPFPSDRYAYVPEL